MENVNDTTETDRTRCAFCGNTCLAYFCSDKCFTAHVKKAVKFAELKVLAEHSENPLLDVDSYKASHYLQYPPGTTSMMSYIESRGGKHSQMIVFGLQYYVKKYLKLRITQQWVDEARDFFAAHGEPFNYEGWSYVANSLDGKLPIRIRALREGTIVGPHVAMVTIESTDEKVPWVVSWVETMLLRLWYPITVAAISHSIKNVIRRYLEKSSDDASAEIAFKLHDFGGRGVSSRESAAIGGAAHLLNFQGSDTVAGVVMLNKFYAAGMAGFSIPAAEHSSITSWGQTDEAEVAAYRNMLKQFGKPNALFACVSDGRDIFNACSNLWGEALRREVQDSGAVVIIRPDSGDPATVVAECVRRLDEKFGSKLNKMGYRVLNNVRVIQGDGINEDSIRAILDLLLASGYSATNVAFGMGGALLQQLNRDTNKFAMKCCSITVNGVEVDVFKDPVTDPGKSSKKGRLDTILNAGGSLETVTLLNGALEHENTAMVLVYENGELITETTLAEIRMLSNG